MAIPASLNAGAVPSRAAGGVVSPEEDVLRSVLPDARRIALRAYKVPAQDVDDVLQQAAVDFLVQSRRGAAATTGLMIVITRRRCLDFWRTRYRARQKEVGIDETTEDPSPCVEECALLDAAAAADGARLARTWPSLSDNCRAVLVRRFWHNQRTADLAERLGYKRETLKRMISRCLGRLRRSLASC